MKNMCSLCIDKTILNLLALLITSVGIFAVLMKFGVPQLNMSFYGENPYAIKRDIIENVMTWIFISVALFGVLIQAYAIICESKLSPNLYATNIYVKFFIIGLLGMFVLLFAFGTIGSCIAKKIWWPKIIEKQTEGFKLAGDIIRNKGFYNEELDKIENFSEEQKQNLPIRRYEQCDEILTQIENLLELQNVPKAREERYRIIDKYFKK